MRIQTRRPVRWLASVAVAGLVLAACGGAEVDDVDVDEPDAAESDEPDDTEDVPEFEERTLTVQTFNLEDSMYAEALRLMTSEVTERTNGAVQFEIHYAGALCPAVEIVECTTDARVDIGMTAAAYQPASFPYLNIGSIPFQTPNLQANTQALYDLYQQDEQFQAELEGLGQRLWYGGPGGNVIIGADQEIETVDDLSGLDIRVVGDVANALEDLGVNAVVIPPDQVYESVQRGVTDGAFGTIDVHMDYNLNEVIDTFYDFSPVIGNYAFHHVAINDATWNEMEPEVQQIFQDVADELSTTTLFDIYRDYQEQLCNDLFDQAEVQSLPDGVQADLEPWTEEWRETLTDNWVESAREAGIDQPEDILEQYRSLLEDAEAQHDGYMTDGEVCLGVAGG